MLQQCTVTYFVRVLYIFFFFFFCFTRHIGISQLLPNLFNDSCLLCPLLLIHQSLLNHSSHCPSICLRSGLLVSILLIRSCFTHLACPAHSIILDIRKFYMFGLLNSFPMRFFPLIFSVIRVSFRAIYSENLSLLLTLKTNNIRLSYFDFCCVYIVLLQYL